LRRLGWEPWSNLGFYPGGPEYHRARDEWRIGWWKDGNPSIVWGSGSSLDSAIQSGYDAVMIEIKKPKPDKKVTRK
jgi:hypothetical protein